jgi:hypothetical protein
MDISSTVVREEGTAVVQCVFTDEDGGAVAPSSLTWTLSDRQGTIINSREDVDVSEGDLASTTNIVLSGNDLAFLTDEEGDVAERIMTLKGVYSSTYGDDLPLRYEILFYISNLVNE